LEEVVAMANLYQTSSGSKSLEIEDTTREGFPFRLVITLQKLGMVTMLDYFISQEEAKGIKEALSKTRAHANSGWAI
jgi:hypothetical protein